MLTARVVTVDVMDNDEYVPDDLKDEVIFASGQAKVTFKDFLRPFCREVKLRSDVFPTKRKAVDNTNNLDLNTTAKRSEKTNDRFSPYLVHNTYVVIKANLAYPIEFFDEQAEVAKFNAIDLAASKESLELAATESLKDKDKKSS